MRQGIRKVVAREGLILVGFVAFGLLIVAMGGRPDETIGIPALCYSIYWAIKFIIWAVRRYGIKAVRLIVVSIATALMLWAIIAYNDPADALWVCSVPIWSRIMVIFFSTILFLKVLKWE